MKVVVSVNDKYLWCLQPFAYLFNKYWGEQQEVVVAGYNYPSFSLPSNFKYYSIYNFNYPKEKWVDGFLRFLAQFREDNSHFVLMLEDYWLCRSVDLNGINVLYDYAMMNPDILRMDLTSDRQFAGSAKDMDYCYHYDIVQAKNSAYEMSLQTAIWNTQLLVELLEKLPKEKHSAWDVELEGTNFINDPSYPYKVVGTRQLPVRYVNGYNSTLGVNKELAGMLDDDKATVRNMIPNLVVMPS